MDHSPLVIKVKLSHIRMKGISLHVQLCNLKTRGEGGRGGGREEGEMREGGSEGEREGGRKEGGREGGREEEGEKGEGG